MSEKKQLDEQQLENVTGGFNFTFYDDSFTEDTKVKTITTKYPWVVVLYPDLQMAANFNLTVATACSYTKISYQQLQDILDDFQSKYDANGNPLTETENSDVA